MMNKKLLKNNKTKSATKHTEYKCTYYKNKNGMGGIAINEKTQTEYVISSKDESYALDKDEVLVAILEHGEKDEQSHGRIIEIKKHNTTNLSGYIQKHKDKFLLKVNTQKFGNYLVIIRSDCLNFDRDELYNTVIMSYPSENEAFFVVELVNKIGFHDDDQSFIAKLLKDSNIPTEFSSAAIEQTMKIKDQIEKGELINRTDLRELPFVTIDGADAKDFDDAVCVTTKDDIFTLYVAIADVATYVTFNSPLDHDAYLRGTSIYFPKNVIPMLPEHLSNGVCSLKPNVDRLTMCCEMKINAIGEIISYKVYNAVINSKARLTYEKVQDWINELSLIPNELVANITNLYLVFHALGTARKKRGAIDFNSVEAVFNFDDHGIVTDLQPRIRLESHQLIEECMLAANVCVADYFLKNNMPTLFRIHPKPSEEKFTALKAYLNGIAVKFEVKYSELAPHHLAELLEETKTHANYPAIEQVVLRSMQLAIYSRDNVGHFGLSYEKYLHFTSPIRRYPDLLVHRALKSIIEKKEPMYLHELSILGEQTSFTERRAEDLSRKIDAYYKCQYAKSHVGKEFIGNVSSVVNFGLFVYIPTLMLDGLLHVTNLDGDYFVFDEIGQKLVGRKTGITYKSGQEVFIEITGVDMAQLFIDFKLANAD